MCDHSFIAFHPAHSLLLSLAPKIKRQENGLLTFPKMAPPAPSFSSHVFSPPTCSSQKYRSSLLPFAKRFPFLSCNNDHVQPLSMRRRKFFTSQQTTCRCSLFLKPPYFPPFFLTPLSFPLLLSSLVRCSTLPFLLSTGWAILTSCVLYHSSPSSHLTCQLLCYSLSLHLHRALLYATLPKISVATTRSTVWVC